MWWWGMGMGDDENDDGRMSGDEDGGIYWALWG